MPSGSQSVGFLERGFVASHSVGRITVRSASGSPAGYGTGFLISPRLLLTNNHMLEGAEVAAHSYVEFNYQSGADGTPLTPVLFGLAPEEFFVTSGALDFVKPGPGPDPAVLRSGLASLEANRNRPYYEEAADAKARERYIETIDPAAGAGAARRADRAARGNDDPPRYRPADHVYPWVDLHPDRLLRSIYSGKEFPPEQMIEEDARVEAARTARLQELRRSRARCWRRGYR